MKKAWIIAGGVVVALGVATPWAVGKLTEQHWLTATDAFNDSQPFLILDTSAYQRGYLGSDMTGQLTFVDPETGERETLGWQGDVSHGVTGSTIDFGFDAQDSEIFNALFPEKKPSLTLTSHAWGSSRIELTVPQISYLDEQTGESLNVSESFSAATIDDNGESFDVTMRWPGLVLRSPEYRMSLENFNLDQSMSLLAGNIWTGEARASLDKVSLAMEAEPEVILEGIEMVSRSSAGEDNDTVGVVTELTLEHYRQDAGEYGPHRIEFQLQDLNVAAWNRVLTAIEEMQNAGLDNQAAPQAAFERQMAATLAIGESLQALAAEGFMAGFTEVDIATPEGSITGRAVISHPPVAADDQAEMAMVMAGLEGEVRLRIPRALAENNPEIAEELAPMIMQGALVEEGDHYVMKATLKDMEIDLNGQVMPIPAMM
ncbi:Uncharacterized conserved protein YdgA, DUF945 family [Marinobacter daqiaonensis]|uniref:Uncharacterized conserved protein YdgA, DUF945 family n=1 Tax=Marinobacter daqiaonensis TaxID=650891 RepID=A0A1I6JRX5_9GAMM|nr:DUF945 family protein [Marinobacter daqiaonensis]SFR81715.1 Uncharacterized conserved protein YdgA, DUF945 family [Marinobacter daqiaonensis]